MECEGEKTLRVDTAVTTASTQESKRQPTSPGSPLTPTGELTLRQCHLHQIPKSLLEDMEELILHLDLRDNDIQTLDSSPIFLLSQLRTLDLRSNRIEYLPEEIASLSHLKVLRLDENLISFLPKTMWEMGLEALTVGSNSLFAVPGEVGLMTKLKTLVVSDNRILSLPREIGLMKNLLALSIHGNEFSSLPTSLFSLSHLKELSLEWFRYTYPPLPRILKGKLGERLIESLCELCRQLHRQGLASCSLIMFLLHFSQEDTAESPKSRRSLMHAAALEGDCGVLKGLIEGGMTVNCIDAEGYSPLGIALREERVNCAKLLLENGADVSKGGGSYCTPLHICVFKQESWLTRYLLKRGAPISARDSDGNTALHVLLSSFSLCPRKSLCIANSLLKAGAPVNSTNNDGDTPLHLAVKGGQIDAVRWILASNRWLKQYKRDAFDIHLTAGDGLTPVHMATMTGEYEITRLLVEVGRAKVGARSREGLTAKAVAKKDLILGKYLTMVEREEAREGWDTGERVEVVDEERSHRVPGAADVLNVSRSLSERYSSLYALFANQKSASIREVASKLEPDSPLLPDVLYLLGQMTDEKALPVIEIFENKRNCLQTTKEELVTAGVLIREGASQLRPSRSTIGPKLHPSDQPLRGSFSLRSLPTYSRDCLPRRPLPI